MWFGCARARISEKTCKRGFVFHPPEKKRAAAKASESYISVLSGSLARFPAIAIACGRYTPYPLLALDENFSKIAFKRTRPSTYCLSAGYSSIPYRIESSPPPTNQRRRRSYSGCGILYIHINYSGRLVGAGEKVLGNQTTNSLSAHGGEGLAAVCTQLWRSRTWYGTRREQRATNQSKNFEVRTPIAVQNQRRVYGLCSNLNFQSSPCPDLERRGGALVLSAGTAGCAPVQHNPVHLCNTTGR